MPNAANPPMILVVRQPWAWCLIHGPKDIENRIWSTNYRGRLGISAAKTCTRKEYYEAAGWILETFDLKVPRFQDLAFGGVIGSVELYDIAEPGEAVSEWHDEEQYGWRVRSKRPCAFQPLSGQLGLFRAPSINLEAA